MQVSRGDRCGDQSKRASLADSRFRVVDHTSPAAVECLCSLIDLPVATYFLIRVVEGPPVEHTVTVCIDNRGEGVIHECNND